MLTSTKPPKCKWCKSRTDKLGKNLHDDCVAPWLEDFYKKQSAKQRKEQAAKAKVERASDKKRKEALKNIADLIDDAQKECNAYIRLRDFGKPCFDCGKPFEPNKPGGTMDAGHVRSRGAAGHLRFDERNIFGQRKNCNRPGGATEEARKAGAAARVGWDVVNELYSDNRVHKWQREELIAIKHTYRAKRRALEREKEEA